MNACIMLRIPPDMRAAPDGQLSSCFGTAMISQSLYAPLSHFGQVAGEREEKHSDDRQPRSTL